MSSRNGFLPRPVLYSVTVMVVRGAIMLLAGLYGLLDPQGALRLIVVISAILLIADGVLGLLGAILGSGGREPRLVDVVSDVISVAFGLLIFISPYLSTIFATSFITMVLGVLAVIAGILELVLVIKFRDLVTSIWPGILLAAAHMGLGIMLLALPYASAVAFVQIVSVLLILYGCGLLVFAWRTQRRMRVVAA